MPLGRSLKPKALKKMACLLIHLNAARIRTASYGWTDDMCAIYPQKRALLSHISNGGGGGGSKELLRKAHWTKIEGEKNQAYMPDFSIHMHTKATHCTHM